MNEYFVKILAELENQLRFIDLETENIIEKSELSITTIQSSLDKLKAFTLKYKFKNQDEEIQFFKHQKPLILGKLLFNIEVHNLWAHFPNSTQSLKLTYLENELLYLRKFYNQNMNFVRYYKSQKTNLDAQYFLRHQFEASLTFDSYNFDNEPKFRTTKDFKVAKILAIEQLEQYITNEITSVQKDHSTLKSPFHPKIRLTWTASKTALVEVVYAFHSLGVFNNGTATIKDISGYFDTTFNTDLSHSYTVFKEIKERKGNQTAFIRSMQDALLKRINEKDDKL